MTREQFERAMQLNTEIQKYSDLIGRIRSGVLFKKHRDKEAKIINDGWTLSRFFQLTFKGKKIIAMPHYEFAQGIEMDADPELIGIIIDYLERKKEACVAEFERIGGNGS